MIPTTIQKIKKRNGSIVEFDPKKIIAAMEKAFGANAVAIDGGAIPQVPEGVRHASPSGGNDQPHATAATPRDASLIHAQAGEMWPNLGEYTADL